MSLFKASMEIAQEYARLCGNRITQKLVYDLVAQEYFLTRGQLLMISQQNRLLSDNERLERSFDTRRKYLDPLNHLQVWVVGYYPVVFCHLFTGYVCILLSPFEV
jgi:phosphoenolpyruvate carboxylase